MRLLSAALVTVILALPISSAIAEELPQSPIPQKAAPQTYPRIVLYSTSWCPHCKAAKKYFTEHNIPFINRDVEIDDDAMTLLTEKYKSQGVPLIVIGNDAEIIHGFNAENFEKVLEKYKKK